MAEELQSYVLMNLDVSGRFGQVPETLWEKEGARVYEIEGEWDAFAKFSGSLDEIKGFGERIISTGGVSVAETYIVVEAIPERPSFDDPAALVTGRAQPRYGSTAEPRDPRTLLEALSDYPGMSRISAVLGGVDLIGEVKGSLEEWHVARREILRELPPYVTIETHRVISLHAIGFQTPSRRARKFVGKRR